MHVDASYKVEDLEKFFNISLNYDNQEEVDTVGGLVFAEINRIPKNNEIFDINNLLKIKIIKATERKIISVEIKRLKN